MSRKVKRPPQADQLFGPPPAAEAGVNREPRVTGTFLIDVSGSRGVLDPATGVYAPDPTYLAGLASLYSGCRSHPATRSSAWVSTTLCGGRAVAPAPYLPFATAELPAVELAGGSPGGAWLLGGVSGLRAEHARMDADGVPSNKDVFVLVSDFHWTDPARWDEAIEAYRRLEAERPQFNGFMVMAGANPNRALANRVSRNRPAATLDTLKVDELFRWVTGMMQQASMSQPGEPVDLPTPTWTLSDGDRR